MYVPAERLTLGEQLYRDLQARYRNMYIPSDFSKAVSCWLQVLHLHAWASLASWCLRCLRGWPGLVTGAFAERCGGVMVMYACAAL